MLDGVTPVIVIAPDVDAAGRCSVDARCVAWIEAAGARTRLADPADAEPLRDASGVLLCGGPFDIPPQWYGAEPVARVDPPREARSRLELALARAAERERLPLLGLCGGAQLMAVARGGTLVQDIATEVPGALEHERGADDGRAVHAARLESGSRLEALLGAREIAVNSTHHQSVLEPGRGVRIAARAPDAVVEAIEDPLRPFWLGVQWHPERLGDTHSERIAAGFVRVARETTPCGSSPR
jgi:putative glutamine amidotransferase